MIDLLLFRIYNNRVDKGSLMHFCEAFRWQRPILGGSTIPRMKCGTFKFFDHGELRATLKWLACSTHFHAFYNRNLYFPNIHDEVFLDPD